MVKLDALKKYVGLEVEICHPDGKKSSGVVAEVTEESVVEWFLWPHFGGERVPASIRWITYEGRTEREFYADNASRISILNLRGHHEFALDQDDMLLDMDKLVRCIGQEVSVEWGFSWVHGVVEAVSKEEGQGPWIGRWIAVGSTSVFVWPSAKIRTDVTLTFDLPTLSG
jgi:hypothetical protein